MEPVRLVEMAQVVAGFGLEVETATRALRYAELLVEASRSQNLVGHEHLEDVVSLLVVDALAAVPWLRGEGAGRRVLDLGTGGGIPGIPLALACPGLEFTLVDATLRKVQFVRQVAEQLQMGNVVAVAGRAEDLGRDAAFREGFDVVLAKAVAPMAVLVELAVPLLKPGGRLLAWKGPQVDQELAEASGALALLEVAVEGRRSYRVCDSQGTWQERVLVEARRTGALNDRYPRRVGMAAKKPLRAPAGS